MTAVINDFAAIRGAVHGGAVKSGDVRIRVLFRQWIDSIRDIGWKDLDEESDAFLAALRRPVDIENEIVVNSIARTAEDFAMKAIMAWFRAEAGAEMDLVESLKDDAVRLLAEVDDPAYANLAEVRS
jgi:hypothetical protein